MSLTKIACTITIFLTITLAGCTTPEKGLGSDGYEEVYIETPLNITIEEIATGLQVPWAIAFLPNTDILVSERHGNIRIIRNSELMDAPYFDLQERVHSAGEGGLMGIAIHPEFPEEPYVYAMHTYRETGNTYNKVIRIRDENGKGVFDKNILERIPGGLNHNGGRIAFGPDGYLYIATGEIFIASLSQELDSLAGKILRVTSDGSIPEDNPFRSSPVYSYGHRNPQGLAWHPVTQDLFSSEHGPSGEYNIRAHDEINIIYPGKNYGWPEVVGITGKPGFQDPLIVWTDTAVPPGGIAFYNETDLFVATLRSRALIRIILDYDDEFRVKRVERWFATAPYEGKYGRLRDVTLGPDGHIYFTTSNRDGRGTPTENDDNIYRLILG